MQVNQSGPIVMSASQICSVALSIVYDLRFLSHIPRNKLNKKLVITTATIIILDELIATKKLINY